MNQMHGTGFGATAAADAFGGIHAGQGAAPAEEAVEQPVARKKTLLAHNGIRQAKGRAGGDERIARQHGRLLHQPPPAGRRTVGGMSPLRPMRRAACSSSA